MSNASKATQMFQDGCACSQAVLGAFCEPLGLSHDEAMRIASGFGGGMKLGETCGAVTGAIMVLGLRHAEADCVTSAGRDKVSERVIQFVDRFKQRNDSINCPELLGCDIRTPEGKQQAREQNLFKTRCAQLVQDAAEILEEMESQS